MKGPRLDRVFSDWIWLNAVKRRAKYFDALYESLAEISNPEALSGGMFSGTNSAGSMAIAPGLAARCLQDYERSMQFMRGLRAAVDDQIEKTRRQINVLYIGTGPFASLALPTMATRTPEQVKFDLLDIHKVSVENLCKILPELGFAHHVRDVF